MMGKVVILIVNLRPFARTLGIIRLHVTNFTITFYFSLLFLRFFFHLIGMFLNRAILTGGPFSSSL